MKHDGVDRMFPFPKPDISECRLRHEPKNNLLQKARTSIKHPKLFYCCSCNLGT